eukprot:gene9239-11319_t
MSDCISRLKRMQGYDVIHPMGWDAFGLPAENAAIAKQISPSDWTLSNIQSMRSQFKQLDLHFDWDRELSTCSPEYYRWTQELFLRLFENGMAYRKLATVNWDPIDKTVLANEQVDAQGRSWRSNALVEKKQMNQWFFKITAMADRLHDDLDQLPGWPLEIKSMQREWIGRSKGHHIHFKLKGHHHHSLTVFTTRAETLYGVSFVAISPKHPLILDGHLSKLLSKDKLIQLDQYLKNEQEQQQQQQSNSYSDSNETFRTFNTDIELVGPTNESNSASAIKLIISSSVHTDYGTGAVMGVPGHNRADYQVAKLENLPIIHVLQKPPTDDNGGGSDCYDTYSGELIQSGEFTGMVLTDVVSEFEKRGWATPTTNYRIHDWLISRQRYWGTPIPIVHCQSCGEVPVPRDQLPIKLPLDVEFTGKGNVLDQLDKWKQCPCPKCGKPSNRETDTMDTFVDSSWYYLRFLDNHNHRKIFDSAIANRFLPVDVYVGGIEHAILHLLYSRFITKFLKDQNLLEHSEPFKILLTQGLVKSPTYRDKITEKPLIPLDVDFSNPKLPISKLTGNPVTVTIEKMSKSKLNGIDPSEIIGKYGSDTLKLYILFKAPPQNSLEWDVEGIEGCKKWLKRVENLIDSFIISFKQQQQQQSNLIEQDDKELKSIQFEVHSTINRITDSIETYSFNTGVSALMTLSNSLSRFSDNAKQSLQYYKALRTLILLLYPYAPNTATNQWGLLVNLFNNFKTSSFFHQLITINDDDQSFGTITTTSDDITIQPWPKSDIKFLSKDNIVLVVQINGKTRGTIDIPASIGSDQQDQIIQLVKSDPSFASRFKSKSISKVFINSHNKGLTASFIIQ